MCYNSDSTPLRQAVAPEREVITMVTYEGIFLFVTMLTGVIALIFDIIKFFKKNKAEIKKRPHSPSSAVFLLKSKESRGQPLVSVYAKATRRRTPFIGILYTRVPILSSNSQNFPRIFFDLYISYIHLQIRRLLQNRYDYCKSVTDVFRVFLKNVRFLVKSVHNARKIT